MKSKANLFLFGSIIVILLAIGFVAVLGNAKPSGPSTDVRARAGNQSALQLVGIVNSVNEDKGAIGVTAVQFANSDRSGEPQNLGDWTVTVPSAFNFASVSQGTAVTIGVAATTFNISSHEVTAITLTAGK